MEGIKEGFFYIKREQGKSVQIRDLENIRSPDIRLPILRNNEREKNWENTKIPIKDLKETFG